MIFFTTGSASASGVPCRTGGRGVTSFAPPASILGGLSDDAVTGDFSGVDLTEEADDFTGDDTGDATGEAFFGKSAANGEPAGATMVSGEATGLGEEVLVLFDWSPTTGLDSSSGGAFGCETSAFEATL